jgi:transcriptional regulator with XRE-family HTH domain
MCNSSFIPVFSRVILRKLSSVTLLSKSNVGTKVSDMNTPKGLTQAVADALTAEKAVQRVTFDTLVEATGVSRSQIIRYFKGTRSMTVAELEAICRVLGLDPLALVAEASRRMRG